MYFNKTLVASSPAAESNVKSVGVKTPKIVRQVPFAKEPYYIPGYAAYVPQTIFRCGDTFGRDTHLILTDDSITKSKNLVLNPIVPPKQLDPEDDFDFSKDMEHIKETWGDRKYVDPMMPGYTGVIPTKDEFYGRRYAKVCADAKRMFVKNTLHSNTKPGKCSAKYFTPNLKSSPLTPLANKVSSQRKDPLPVDISLIGDKPVTFAGSYAGFIPRSRDRFAKAYRPLTQQAIKKFVHDTRQHHDLLKRPVTLRRKMDLLHETDREGQLPIYREEGMIPTYNGHLPGHRDRHGQTYNASARQFFIED